MLSMHFHRKGVNQREEPRGQKPANGDQGPRKRHHPSGAMSLVPDNRYVSKAEEHIDFIHRPRLKKPFSSEKGRSTAQRPSGGRSERCCEDGDDLALDLGIFHPQSGQSVRSRNSAFGEDADGEYKGEKEDEDEGDEILEICPGLLG